jgi:exopolyphosphatase/pppGpp-phosphohydrolase
VGARFVIDCGSRSIKLHSASPSGITLWATRSWDPIGDRRSARSIDALLSDLARFLPDSAPVLVVGTAAARRSRQLARAIGSASSTHGWSYRTLSQQVEARLIRDAFVGHSGCDIVNAGGGSIQIVDSTGALSLLDFGITDLNASFDLSGGPAGRNIAAATAFIAGQLPNMRGAFIYSGGELSYLRAAGARLDEEGRCTAAEFLRVASRVDAMNAEQLRGVSPFDPGWSRGAVASNAIVRACLARSGSDFYYASDVNIADGIIRRLAGSSVDAASPGL